MKNKSGFTLVEVLAVLVLIALLTVIAIPAINSVSKKTKQRIYNNKVESAKEAIMLWAKDNENCFRSEHAIKCIVGLNNNCSVNSNIVTCNITLGTLASNDLIFYDKIVEDEKVIINPVTNLSINDEVITLVYDNSKRIFSFDDKSSHMSVIEDPSLPNPDSTEAKIYLNADGSTTWTNNLHVDIIITGGSGLASGGTLKYGFSTSNTVAPKYTNLPVNYAVGTKTLNTSIANNSLNGKYYLWVAPDMKTTDNQIIALKVSNKEYFIDTIPPTAPVMSFVYADWTKYNGEVTDQNVYAAQSSGLSDYSCITQAGSPSGAIDSLSGINKYQISTDNITWEDYQYNCNNSLYKLSGSGHHVRYFRACDRAGNCGPSTAVNANIDAEDPSITLETIKTGTNEVVTSGSWSDKGLDFKLTETNCGASGCTIKYCKDTNNTCTPNITTSSGNLISNYNGLNGIYYFRYQIVSNSGASSEIQSFQAKVDKEKPTVKVTTYKYSSTATNNVGEMIMNETTYMTDSTLLVSSNWVDYGATFKFVNSAVSGIKSVKWKWNTAGLATDTGSTYSGGPSTPTTSYASLSATGYRKGQWIVEGNTGKITTITVAVKIGITCNAGEYLAKNTTSCISCPAGKYCVGGVQALSNSADQGISGNCNAGSYSESGASAATCIACAQGSYSAGGAASCTACQPSGATGTGGTTTGTGQASCNTSCGKSNVATWNTATWDGNLVNNSCSILTCESGYELISGNCVQTSCTVYCTSPDNCSTTKPTSSMFYGTFTCDSATGKTGSVSECWYGSTKCDGGTLNSNPTTSCTLGGGQSFNHDESCSSTLSHVSSNGLGLSSSGYSCSC